MKFSYNWLQEFVKEKLPEPKKLAEILSLRAFEIEGIEKKGSDWVLDVKVTANRASDCSSHSGLAREIAAIGNWHFLYKQERIKEDTKNKTQDFISVEVKDKKASLADGESRRACNRYICRVVEDVKVGPSPRWLIEKLKACGLQPINNIVDAANYVMLETGQPLHAFDLEKLESANPKSQITSSKQIPNSKFQKRKLIVRFAKAGEEITTLDEQRFSLDPSILVIADEAKPVAIAGIKGGKGPGIDKKTKTIVLESANFDATTVRRASQKLKLKTDASYRFEHGIDPNLAEPAIDRAAFLIKKLAGGKVAKGMIDFYPVKAMPGLVVFDPEKAGKILGLVIPQKESLKILKNLGFEAAKGAKGKFNVKIPTRRLDVSLEEDLVEEVGRIYGYEKIPVTAPMASLIPPEKNYNIFWEELTKDSLKEAGLTEVYNYSFISNGQRELFRYKEEELLELENPLNDSQQFLCPSLIPGLLQDVKKNAPNFEEIRIFEIGKTFKNDSVQEKRVLTGLIAKKSGKDIFYELKGIVGQLLEKMGIVGVWYDEYRPTPEQSKPASPAGGQNIWRSGCSAEIKVGDKEIGFLGEINPDILRKLKIENKQVCFLNAPHFENKVVVFDLDFEKLRKLASEEQEYQIISPYPAAARDLAVLLPQGVKVVEVLNLIESSGGKLLRDVELFDIYEGDGLPVSPAGGPEDKKSLAFHLVYQAEDRTLSGEEIEKIHQKIIKALEENEEWELRR